MNRPPLPPELERRALALVDDLVESVEDLNAIDTTLAREEPCVRSRVLRLLGCARTAGDDLPTIVTGADAEGLPVPESFGAFRLVEEIGSGGMVAVARRWAVRTERRSQAAARHSRTGRPARLQRSGDKPEPTA